MGAERDSLIRIALVAMALVPSSDMTAAQRRWVLEDLAHRTTPFTEDERLRLQGPLVLWMRKMMPNCVALIEKQFPPHEVAHGETQGAC